MADNYGWVRFPGIDLIEECSFTDVSGPSPAKAILTIYPQANVPNLIGDLVFTYNGVEITIKNMIIDSASYVRNSGGKVVRLVLLDERWKWQYGQITGRYNIRMPNNFVGRQQERTPRQLARLCFSAMGVRNFNADVLPNDARPDIDWQAENPAEALARMCDDLGCRIVPQRSTNTWVICVTGEGAFPSEDLPYQDAGTGIDPKELPDFIQVVTDDLAVQCTLVLEPAGKDTDQTWQYPRDLTYTPNRSDRGTANYDIAFGFGPHSPIFSNLSPTRVQQEDGTAISPQELAQRYLYRTWRISVQQADGVPIGAVSGDPIIKIEGLERYGLGDRYKRKEIILTDQLAQCYTDAHGEIHQRPAFVWGIFENRKGGTQSENYPDGTRIDFQASSVYDPEERASFSLSVDPLDTERSIISTSQPMRKLVSDTRHPNPDGSFPSCYEFATLRYTCAVNLRDTVKWQPYRYFRKRNLGRGNDPANVLTLNRRDIKPWIINKYSRSGVYQSTTDNLDDVNRQCDYYINQEMRKLEVIATDTRTYIGLFPIDMDGAIQQVTYRTGKQGHDTIVSRGSEHDFDIPTYTERRQRDGRQNLKQLFNLVSEINKRRESTQGTFNTL